jgi:peptide/nickel transport system permease protein
MDQLNAIYGLNTGIIQGFFQWIGSAIGGNFGDSWYS